MLVEKKKKNLPLPPKSMYRCSESVGVTREVTTETNSLRHQLASLRRDLRRANETVAKQNRRIESLETSSKKVLEKIEKRR